MYDPLGECSPRELWASEREFRQLAGDGFCCKKHFVLEYYGRYVNHMTSSCIFKNQIFKLKKTGISTYQDPGLGLPKNKKIEQFSTKKIFTQGNCCVKATLECLINKGAGWV